MNGGAGMRTCVLHFTFVLLCHPGQCFAAEIRATGLLASWISSIRLREDASALCPSSLAGDEPLVSNSFGR